MTTFGDFTSWRGQASPTGAFANELGNLLYAPVVISGTNGTHFSLSQIVITGDSGDMRDNAAGSLLGNVTDLNNCNCDSKDIFMNLWTAGLCPHFCL